MKVGLREGVNLAPARFSIASSGKCVFEKLLFEGAGADTGARNISFAWSQDQFSLGAAGRPHVRGVQKIPQ